MALVPVVVYSSLLPQMNLTLLVLAGFIGELLVLISFKRFCLSLVAFLVLANGLVMLVTNTILGVKTLETDYINILVKFVTISMLFSTMKTIKIDKVQYKSIAKFFTTVCVVACFYNFYANFNMFNASLLSMNAYEFSFQSFFLNRNQFGMFLVVSLFFMELLFEPGDKKKYLVFAFVILNLILTLSRGSMISAILFLLLLYFFEKGINGKVFFALLFLSVVLLAFIVNNNFISSFFANFVIRSDYGTSGRTEIWKYGFEVLKNINFINGCGFFSGVEMAHDAGMTVGQFHSLYIDSLIDGGFVYLAIVMGLYYSVYKRCNDRISDKHVLSTYRAFAIAVLVMGLNESVSFFSIGWVDTQFTIACFSYPLLLSSINWNS